MNMFKKNGGFTLVELIVVIAILAILAGVAVPVYSGYISKANEAADLTQLDSIKTATVFAVMEKNPMATVDTITINNEQALNNVGVGVTVPTGDTAISSVDITPYMGTMTTFKFQSKTTKAEWAAVAAGDVEQGWTLTPVTTNNNNG